MSTPKKIILLVFITSLIVLFLLYAFNIIPFNQNIGSESGELPETVYTNMTLRTSLYASEIEQINIQFGDTEYIFRYQQGKLYISGPFPTDWINNPKEGKTYYRFGIEIFVATIGSDYISKYITILVRPTVEDYMASLYYTKVNITQYETKAVNISSGLIDKTNQYWFTYIPSIHRLDFPTLTIKTTSQTKKYSIPYGVLNVRDFDIETRVYKIEPTYMIIYVKPLY